MSGRSKPTRKKLAAELGVSKSTLLRWLQRGAPDGSADEIREWRVANERKKGRDPFTQSTARSDVKTQDFVDEDEDDVPVGDGYWENRYRKAKTQKAELEVEALAGSKIDKAEHLRILTARMVAFRRRLMTFARRIVPEIQGLSIPEQIQGVQAEMESILEDIAETGRIDGGGERAAS